MDSKLKRLIDGGAAIVSHGWLDSMACTDYGSEIRTCYNRDGVGVKDMFVAWIYPSGQPHDLEHYETKGGLSCCRGSLPANTDNGFELRNDAPKPRHKRGEFFGQERTLQKVLIDGLDCLPGQGDLF